MSYSNKIIGTLLAIIIAVPAFAQHPVDVQKKTAEGDHFRALANFDKLPRRRKTKDAKLAAAKSSWALGLSKRAVKEYEELLRSDSLSEREKAEILLSRGIIELQEERPEVALVYAEKTIKVLESPSPLRSRAWMLWGEGLYASKSYGPACNKFKKAVEEALPLEKPDIEYQIGRCERKLGKYEEAINHFQRIPLYHPRTPDAVRNLAQVSLDQSDFKQAAFWLEKGKQEHPGKFLDSWVDYAFMQIAIHNEDSQTVKQIRVQAQEKYPPSDAWLALLNAAAQAFEWRKQEEQQNVN